MEKQKLIYVESKAQFSPSEVSDKAIVFIKDTKEIWTHGVYFSCSGTWATPITLSLTGDTTGSVSIDGSGNASIATTTNYLSIISQVSDANSAANTKSHAVSYYRINSGSSNLFPVSNNANGILSLNVHDYSYTHQLGFSSDGNIYHRRRNGGTWETSWKTILNSSNYTNFPHTFASLTNKPTTLSGYGITDCIPIINGGIVTTDTDLSTLGMTTSGVKFSISMTTDGAGVPSWWTPYSNFLMFRSTGDTYSGIATYTFSEQVTFVGGRNLETTANNVPNWWFRIKGASGTTYDLNSFQNIINNLDSNYLRKSGGTMTGNITLTTDAAYITDSKTQHLIFGTISPSTTTGVTGVNGMDAVFAGRLTNMVLRTSGDNLYHYNHSKSARYLILDTNNYSSYALPLSGGTMKGALNLANNTWNKVGDDAYMGDCNVAGMIGIKGSNATTPGFAMYNNSGTLLGKLYASGTSLYWSDAKILTASGTSKQFVMGDGSLYSDTVSYTTWTKTTTSGIAWFPIADIPDSDQGTALFMVRGYAHSSIIFTVTKGYNNGNINVLAGGGSFNGSYAYIKGVRQVGTVVEIGLNAAATYVSVVIKVLQPTFTYSLRSSLVESTNTATPYVQYDINSGGNSDFGIISSKFTGNLIGNADTASNISTVNPILAQPFEKNTIQVVSNPQGALAEQQGAGAAITHALRFNWYNTAYEIGNVRGGTSNSLGFGVTYGNNNLCLLVKTNGTYSPYGFIGDLTGNAASANKWAIARTITLTGDVTGSVTLDGSSNVTLATTTSGTGTTSFLKCPDKRNSYPAQIVTSSGNIGASFMSASKLGLSDGSYYDAVILRGYADSSGGNENALLFSKNSSSVYHSQYAFGSTTTWGTMYKFLDSGNYTNYTINNTKSGINNTGFVGVVNGNNLYHHSELSFARFAPTDANPSYELIAELTNYNTGTNTGYITYGISGFMWSYRAGACTNSSAYPITAIVSIGPATFSRIRVSVTTGVLIPFIVKYNNKYYLALRQQSSSTAFYFMGQKLNLLTTTIKVTDPSLIEEIKGPEVETSTASKFYNNGNPQEYLHAGNYKNFYPIKLLYPRTLWGQSFDGTANVNGAINIVRDSSFVNNYTEGVRIQGAANEWAGIFLGTNGTASGQIATQWNLNKTASDTFRISRGASSTSLLEILNSGNVGIGTSSPSEKLQVNGNTIIGGNATVGTYSTNNSLTIKSQNSSGVAYLNFDNGYYATGNEQWKGYIAVSGWGDTSMRTEGNGLPGENQVIHGMIFKLPRIDIGDFAFRNGRDQDVARISTWGVIVAKAGFKVSGGTSSQFLKADGSLDSTSYLKVDGTNGTSDGVSTLLNKLSTGSSTPTDADYYICQWAGGGTTTTSYHRRPMSAMYAYIKSKATSDFLPIGGGTLGSSSASFTDLFIKSSTAKLRLLSYSNSTNYIQSGNSAFNGNADLKITGYLDTTGSNLYFKFANIYCRADNYTNIDSGNYNSYALPLSGGTLTGTLISRDIRPSANVSYSLGTSSYYYNYVYAKYFKKNGSSDSYVLLGGGGHKAVSDFTMKEQKTTTSISGNTDQWSIILEQSYPADHWYDIVNTFLVEGVQFGSGFLSFYAYWQVSSSAFNNYITEVYFNGTMRGETTAGFGGSNRDINDFLRIYIDKTNYKLLVYANHYNGKTVRIKRINYNEIDTAGFPNGGILVEHFNDKGTIVSLPTESSTMTRVLIKTHYNHDRTIKTSKSIYASSFYENSDIRLKENIQRIDQSDLTKQVDLVQFNFKDSDTKKYGVIAQQLEQVGLQNLVYENDGKKAVDYISLLVLEIQRLRNEIGELKQEINKKS